MFPVPVPPIGLKRGAGRNSWSSTHSSDRSCWITHADNGSPVSHTDHLEDVVMGAGMGAEVDARRVEARSSNGVGRPAEMLTCVSEPADVCQSEKGSTKNMGYKLLSKPAAHPLHYLDLLGAATGSPYIVFISTSGMLRSSDIYIYI